MNLQQRRVSTNFRDNALLNVFKTALIALRYLLDNRADDKLKDQVGWCNPPLQWFAPALSFRAVPPHHCQLIF
jgi:hypothetical protein